MRIRWDLLKNEDSWDDALSHLAIHHRLISIHPGGGDVVLYPYNFSIYKNLWIWTDVSITGYAEITFGFQRIKGGLVHVDDQLKNLGEITQVSRKRSAGGQYYQVGDLKKVGEL